MKVICAEPGLLAITERRMKVQALGSLALIEILSCVFFPIVIHRLGCEFNRSLLLIILPCINTVYSLAEPWRSDPIQQ